MQNLLSQHSDGSGGFGWSRTLLLVAAVAALVFGSQQSWFPVKFSFKTPELLKMSTKQEDTSQDQVALSEYTAVYLDTDQVFYGKFKGESGDYVVLTDAFYYQPGVRSLIQGNIRIIKLGTEIHQPEDRVNITKSHITMRERLLNDSKVVKAILKYKAE